MQVKSKTLIVGVLAVVVVGLLWYMVVYSPIKSKTSKANTAAQTAQTEVDNLQRQIDQLNAADKKAKAADIGAAQMLAAVPADAAEASFLRTLDALRVATAAGWQSVTPSPPTAAGNVASINVSIQVQGTEDQLARYLAGIYGMRRIFIVDNVTLNPGQPDPRYPAGALFTGGIMQAQITGRIFAALAAVPSSSSSTSRASTGASTSASSSSSSTSG